MQRLLLRGGTLIDGTGGKRYSGDLLIEGERIAALGKFDAPADAACVDATGYTVAPGFIDAHSHSDLQVLENRPEKPRQGVTTEVVGNCGFSPYPAAPDRGELHSYANGIFCGDDSWGWASARQYLADVANHSWRVGAASLVGHGTLRIAFAGNRLGALEETTIAAMESALAECLDDGAAGFSTGLMYAPGSSAPFSEIERLCRVVARKDKVYCTHMRSYSRELVESVDEQLELARRTGARLQISHLQAVGPANWDKQRTVLDKLEQARQEGIDVRFDCYPYLAGSTVLTQLLPQWVLEGGIPAMLKRLTDPDERKKIARETIESMSQRWIDVFISAVSSAGNQWTVGKNMADIAEARGVEPIEAALDLLVQENGEVNFISFNQTEENLKETLSHPLSLVISDGFYVKGRPHPRLHGTFPLLLGEMSRRRGWMSLEEAVRKITSAPADRFGLKDRGRLAPGAYADVVVFDANGVDSPATYDNPEAAPVGIKAVYRNGVETWPANSPG